MPESFSHKNKQAKTHGRHTWPRISPWTILTPNPEHPKKEVKQLHLNKKKEEEKEMQLYVNAS